MHELDDHALLRLYAEQNSEAAFAALVTRHVDKVYSVALRHTRNAHAAEEITQAVFVILAKKSRRLGAKVILSGWLYETARLTAVTLIRSEIRRARREQEAYMQTALNENDSEAWPHIAPLLDDALAGLSAADRHAIVLRYFDGKSLGEVGTALGASEDAAKKRVTRAVEKLRGFFTKRGVTLTATVLTAAISANSVQAAPLGLAATVTATAAKGTLISATLTMLVNTTMKIMTWLKIKFASGVMVAALLAVGGCLGKVSVKHARAFEAAQKKLIAESLVVVYASADTSHLPNIRLVVREIWKGSAEASAIGVTNGMELLIHWGARDGNPPDHAVVCFPARVSSSTPIPPEMLAEELKHPQGVIPTEPISSSTASENYTEYPVRGGKVSGMWSIQEFKSKFGL